uniref:B2168_C1_182 n=1 Tax=Mycobacterium leprae TaxID=1769 RepID=Q49831_MYCLR|nr:hypothetical protein [Mycobacterium leprae]AAA17261.1 B2168_C1_182 [Mycobacterium leprae]
MTAKTEANRKPLFYESGANWIGTSGSGGRDFHWHFGSGAPMQLVVLLIFLVLVSWFVGLQVKPAQIQSSVEPTYGALCRGVETILVAEIVKILSGNREFTGVQ